MPKDYLDIYASYWKDYLASDIQPSESALLYDLRENWARARVLYLGIGAGRTTWFFAPLVDYYVGVDIVPRMVKECVSLFGETARRKFSVADAKDLSQFGDRSFDVVVFSYNGIDHLDHQARAVAFAEVRRVLKPGGVFFFCSHSLHPYPFDPSKDFKLGVNPLHWFGRLRKLRRWVNGFARANAIVQSAEVRERGWAVLPDQAHDWGLHLYYSRPRVQKRELETAGFTVDKILNFAAKPIPDLDRPGPDWWFYYFCRTPRG